MFIKKVPYKLRGHEKFTIREGWLNKGLLLIEDYPKLFLEKDAPDKLGVGNNMVKSIRYWLKAFNLINEKVGQGAKITKLGSIIKENDPYLEDIFTLWLLHSNLTKNISDATVCYMLFNRFDLDEFNKTEANNVILNEIIKYVGHNNFSVNSIKDDIDVLLNMYCNQKEINNDPEDKNISPFANLGLISKKGDIYFKRQPDLSALSEYLIIYELCCMMQNEDSISIDRVSIEDNGLSNIYNLSNVNINLFLDKLDSSDFIRVDRTAGIDMIYKKEKIKKMNELDVIKKYYSTHK